jgi:hypothetical protein
MPPSSVPPHRRARLSGFATALMCALAGGAVWCLLALYSRGELAWFAFPIAALLAWVLRAHGYARASGALLAAALVLLASIYAYCLQAVASVASTLGLPMREALLRMDPAMTLAIARRSLDGWSLATVLAAALLAAVLVLRPRRRPGA